MHFNALRTIPCKDVSPEEDEYDATLSQYSPVNITRWSAFKNFLDLWEEANEGAPLEMKKETASDIKYLREYGCDYLKNTSLWDSLNSYEAWQADAQNNKTMKSPYFIGRNLCVRGRGHKPLSLFCPEACGCHRGDEDCPLTCPERDETTPTCPAHQARIFVMKDKDALWEGGYYCPRRPLTHSVDVGNKGVSAEEIRSILSPPPPPPENCALASTGACLEGGGLDPDCCAPCGEGSCAPGYTYAGQFFIDEETISSTYPDFYPGCGEIYCGNTCCVPTDEWDGARTAAGD